MNVKEVSYIELIKFKDNTMTTIKDEVKLKDIISKLNSLNGKKINEEVEVGLTDFINIYDNKFKRVELARNESYVKLNGVWYKLDSRSTRNFDSVFEIYN